MGARDGHGGRVEVAARLYETMLRVRRFEQAAATLWWEGRISGEFHSSIGEEAVAAGVIDHLVDGDALAADHRSTGPLIARGVEPGCLLRELVGSEDGLCAGWGGHMHLLSPEHLATSDGIVGAAGPRASGFALAAQRLRQDRLAVAFFGEGAANQGMLLEAFNLAVAWKLPVLFVCKDSRWAITTRSSDVTGGRLDKRARAFGLRTARADGSDVETVWSVAGELVPHVRRGQPAFLRVEVRRPEGHLLDDALLRPLRDPPGQARELGGPMLSALKRPGTRPRTSARGLGVLARRFMLLAGDRAIDHDPLPRVRERLEPATARAIEERVGAEIDAAVRLVPTEVGR
jgi:acetoin:2,6-dichlorophenolindophenol oxidoreductase subunit alpha